MLKHTFVCVHTQLTIFIVRFKLAHNGEVMLETTWEAWASTDGYDQGSRTVVGSSFGLLN